MNQIDVLFIVDVTSSMGSFINSAKEKMQDALTKLTADHQIDLKVGLSFYRDHPRHELSFTTVTFDLMDVDSIREKIKEVEVSGGGGDFAAVLDGVADGIDNLSWREKSRKVAFLIGDAPAHGMIPGEDCCICGLSIGDVVAKIQDKEVVLYTILIDSRNDGARQSFKLLANFTGGFLIESDDAMKVILDTLNTEFDNMNLDAKILDMLSKDYSQEKICEMLNVDREKLQMTRLRS
ncbi:MAG: vWA domain-containing protein [Nitrosarchaeum sp.]|nr:vWA domain-containing protein [Nitrosarchaeum sp.]